MTPKQGVYGSILYGCDELIAAFVRARIPAIRSTGFGPHTALGIVQSDVLVGGVVFTDYIGHDIKITVAMDNGKRVLPRALKQLFRYPFVQLGVTRISAAASADNLPSLIACDRLGFRQEGVRRCGFDGQSDEILFGMLREECRWIRDNMHAVKTAAAGNA